MRTASHCLGGPVEVDETCIGGLERNKHADKKLNAGRGGVGKSIVVGVKDRETKRIDAEVIPDTRVSTLQGFVEDRTEQEAQLCTDDGKGHVGMDRPHESVNHSAGESVREQAHTNGVECFWSMLERAHKGTFHTFSKKHLNRYVTEFEGRHNARDADAVDQMDGIVAAMVGKQLTCEQLIAGNGLPAGARQ